MITATVTKAISVKGDFVLIPRREYDALTHSRGHKPLTSGKEAAMTPTQKKALLRARKARKEGTLLSFDEFSRKLGFKS